jgi:signal transduction histidine kinase
MARSLQRTLAVRYALTMALALVGIGLWLDRGVRRVLLEVTDRAIHTTYQLQALTLAAEGRITPGPGPLGQDRFIAGVNRLVLVRDSLGRVLEANVALARGLPLDRTALAGALGGKDVFITHMFEGGRARSVYGPIPAGGPSSAAVLQVAASLTPFEDAARRILTRMLGTAIAAAALTLIGAWWLTGSSLAPVAEIAAQAASVRAGRTGQRITVHGDVDELRSLVQVLNGMLERVDRFSEWHRRIVRDLGHDLRTPITALRAEMELALHGDRKPEEYRRLLAGCLEEVERLTTLADALSLLGRLESGELLPPLKLTDLREPVAASAARIRERTDGHALQLTAPPGPVIASADGSLIERALDEVLDNALRHTTPGRRIELRLAEHDDQALITVEDDGGGVADEMLPHLFEPFYRADAARGPGGGPGLGLTLVAAIVERHRGRVRAERSAKGGLRVRIELPRVTA